MPQINVTPPIVAGANAASGAAGGFAQGVLANRQHELAKRQLALREKLAAENLDLARDNAARQQQMVDARLGELGRQGEERAGRLAAHEQYARIRGRQYEPADPLPVTGEMAFWGGSDIAASSIDQDENVEPYLAEQRSQVMGYAETLSPDARRTFLEENIPQLVADEQDEREGVAARRAVRLWKEALNSGVLEEDEAAIGTQALEGLEQEATSAQQALEALSIVRDAARKRLERQSNLEWGVGWGQQQIQEATAGGADIGKLNSVLTDWLTSEKREPRDLQRRILRARYGVDIKAKKLGRAEVSPEEVPFGSPRWFTIAERESEREAREILGRDPMLRAQLQNKDKPLDAAEYEKQLARVKRTVLQGYAAEFGADEADVAQIGLAPMNAAERQERVNALREKFKAAGLGDLLDKPLSEIVPKQQQPRTENPSNLGNDADARDVNKDGVYDEADIEAAAGPSDGRSSSRAKFYEEEEKARGGG